MIDWLVPTQALVLVADGRRARLLRNTGTPLHMKLATELELQQDNPPTRLQGTGRPGRYHGPDGASGAVEQTDWHQLQEKRFATQIADQLYRMAHAHEFEALVIVAAPRVLGELRAALHEEVVARIVVELPKDAVALPHQKVAKLLLRAASGD